MITWNDRLLPHPLLAPWTDDYGDATFVANVPHAVLNNGKQINLTIKYHCTSQFLKELVAQKQAQYVGLIACAKTFNRRSYPTYQEEDLRVLDAPDYAAELRLTPYITSVGPIEKFASTEFVQEIRNVKHEFAIPSGSILAVGLSTDIILEEGGSPYSVVDLVPDHRVDKGSFSVDLEDNRIKIHLAPEDKQRIDVLRVHGVGSREMATLFPALYLHAVAEALRNLHDYDDTHWAHTMRRALQRNDIDEDDESLKFKALDYAQLLMEKPMGTLLKAYDSGEEE